LLTEKVHEQDELLSSITQENALMSDRIEVLEGDIEEYEKIGKELGLRNQLRDYYNEGLLQMALEKTTDQREIYKKTIKKMCENFNINHNDVCKIIDDIKNDKSQQREL
jgi:hypothetical protein